MNNFKKFVAVLLGVVMACVFATSAFAADVQNTAKAKATIQGFLAQKGVTTLSRTVDSLTPSQLATIRDNQSALVNAVNNTASSVAGTADANSAITYMNEGIKTVNGLLPAGVSVEPVFDISDASKLKVNVKVTANGITETASAEKSLSASANPLLLQSSRLPVTTLPLCSPLQLWLLPASSAWPSARSVLCKTVAHTDDLSSVTGRTSALPVFVVYTALSTLC